MAKTYINKSSEHLIKSGSIDAGVDLSKINNTKKLLSKITNNVSEKDKSVAVNITASDIRSYSKAGPIAKKIGLCSKTITRWADKGIIKRYKISDRICLYDEQEIIDFIDAARVTVGGEVIR